MNIALLTLALTLAQDAPPVAPATPENAAPTVAPASPAAANEEIEEIVTVTETDPTQGWYFGPSYTEHTRVLALQTARTLRKDGWEFLIDHRASAPFHAQGSTWADTFHNFGGLDSSLSIGLALRYSVQGLFDVGIYRAKVAGGIDTYQFDGRYQVLKQENMGVDVAVVGGITWFSQPDMKDASGFLGQLFVDRVLFNRLLVGSGLMYHSSSTNKAKYKEDIKYSVAVPVFAEFRITGGLALATEVVTGLAGYWSKYPAYSAGLKYFTNRHTFAFVFGNTADLTADGYITNSQKGFRDSVIGFNLTRAY